MTPVKYHGGRNYKTTYRKHHTIDRPRIAGFSRSEPYFLRNGSCAAGSGSPSPAMRGVVRNYLCGHRGSMPTQRAVPDWAADI